MSCNIDGNDMDRDAIRLTSICITEVPEAGPYLLVEVIVCIRFKVLFAAKESEWLEWVPSVQSLWCTSQIGLNRRSCSLYQPPSAQTHQDVWGSAFRVLAHNLKGWLRAQLQCPAC